jgi:diadenosine tetraphosphatase ApaH/serine/threonine PP2A family protein phosphatase
MTSCISFLRIISCYFRIHVCDRDAGCVFGGADVLTLFTAARLLEEVEFLCVI